MTEFPTEPENAEQRASYEEIRRHPPEIVWARVRGGIWVMRSIKERPAAPIKRKRPKCACPINTSAARRPGDHHDEGCGRRQKW